MENKKRFNLIEEYGCSLLYIKKIRKLIYLITGIFVVSALIGFFISSPEFISKFILNYIEGLLETTKGFGIGEMFGFIFLNNIKGSFFGVILGVILGVFPVWGALSNGYVLGFVASKVVAEQGSFVLLRLIPHGIFELPAIFISLGMGLKLGLSLFRKKGQYDFFRENLIQCLRVFALIIVPLLIIAAILESLFMFLL